MLHFDLERPVKMLWFGEFLSPARGWKHLTRRLYEYELMIVTEGVLFIADADREYEVHAGEYLIMSPTRRQHGTRVCSCRFYWMHFHCPALPAAISMPALGRYRDGEAITSLAHMLLASEAEEPRSVRSQYLATQILLELSRGQAGGAEAAPPLRALCERIKTYVLWHRFSGMKVADLAHELGYHEKYLSAVFHETEGVTLKRYITAQRAAEAERLLLETDYTVSQIAYYLHFESPHNFSRFFKNATGLSPVEFRTSHLSREPSPCPPRHSEEA